MQNIGKNPNIPIIIKCFSLYLNIFLLTMLENKQKHNALEDAKMLADVFVKNIFPI